jgi:branched-chain amino acid transport system permease protein
MKKFFSVVACSVAAPFVLKPYGIYLLSLWVVMTIAAIGLNLTLGYAGRSRSRRRRSWASARMPRRCSPRTAGRCGCAFLLAIAARFAIGWLLGYPALRVQHHYLAFVTLSFATLVFLVLRNEEWLTKGVYGISGIPRPTLLGWSTKAPIDFYFFCLGMLALVARRLVADALALGPRLHRAAREPDPRRLRSASIRGATR